MAATVCVSTELFTFAPFLALPAAQRAAVPALIHLAAVYGVMGYLPWTERELRFGVHLGPKQFTAFVAWLERHRLGSLERNEAGAVIGLSVFGMLRAEASCIDQQEPLPYEVEQERQRQVWREQKQRQRAERDGVDMSAEKGGHQVDMSAECPSRTRAFDRSIDIEDDISSNSNDRSIEPPSPIVQPPVALTMVPADIAQSLVRYGFSERRSRIVLEEKKDQIEHIKLVLACIPYLKCEKGKEGRLIEYLIANPEKLRIPPQVTQGSLNLLTGQQGGAPPKVQQPVAQPVDRLKEARERLTEAELQKIRAKAIERLQVASRAEYDNAIAKGLRLGSLLTREIREAEDAILRGQIQKAVAV